MLIVVEVALAAAAAPVPDIVMPISDAVVDVPMFIPLVDIDALEIAAG
jgi:hypothetical protein